MRIIGHKSRCSCKFCSVYSDAYRKLSDVLRYGYSCSRAGRSVAVRIYRSGICRSSDLRSSRYVHIASADFYAGSARYSSAVHVHGTRLRMINGYAFERSQIRVSDFYIGRMSCAVATQSKSRRLYIHIIQLYRSAFYVCARIILVIGSDHCYTYSIAIVLSLSCFNHFCIVDDSFSAIVIFPIPCRIIC